MKSIKKKARITGMLYLLLIITGIVGLMYIPMKLMVKDNALETYTNIFSNNYLYKFGIVSELAMCTIFIFLGLAIYRLLQHVNKNVAITMMALIVVSVALSYANLVNKLDVISIMNGVDLLKSVDVNEQQLQVMLALESYSNGVQLNQILWGLWLAPFGYLVFKSRMIPKFFGIFLMLGCLGYVSQFLGNFLFPDSYGETLFATIIGVPSDIGELGICLWLLIMGAKEAKIPTAAVV